jgi:predicted transcriptional regulator
MGEGTVITRIMSKVGLTTVQAKDYISFMISKGLLDRVVESKSRKCRYKSTTKGIHYLKMTDAVSGLFNSNTAKFFRI